MEYLGTTDRFSYLDLSVEHRVYLYDYKSLPFLIAENKYCTRYTYSPVNSKGILWFASLSHSLITEDMELRILKVLTNRTLHTLKTMQLVEEIKNEAEDKTTDYTY